MAAALEPAVGSLGSWAEHTRSDCVVPSVIADAARGVRSGHGALESTNGGTVFAQKTPPGPRACGARGSPDRRSSRPTCLCLLARALCAQVLSRIRSTPPPSTCWHRSVKCSWRDRLYFSRLRCNGHAPLFVYPVCPNMSSSRGPRLTRPTAPVRAQTHSRCPGSPSQGSSSYDGTTSWRGSAWR